MRKFDVIKRPILTEKTYAESNLLAKYTFEVAKDASKREIAIAFNDIFSIKPIKVNVINQKPARVRTGSKRPSMSAHLKKAIISLPLGTKLNIFGDEVQPESNDVAVKNTSEKINQSDEKIKREIKDKHEQETADEQRKQEHAKAVSKQISDESAEQSSDTTPETDIKNETAAADSDETSKDEGK